LIHRAEPVEAPPAAPAKVVPRGALVQMENGDFIGAEISAPVY
jgi:hypothetical protein